MRTSSLVELACAFLARRRPRRRRTRKMVSSLFAPARGVAGEADRDDQRGTLEDRLDEEGVAELLQPGDADGEHEDGNDRAPGVHPPGPDRGRAEERADESGEQEFRADRALRHLEA